MHAMSLWLVIARRLALAVPLMLVVSALSFVLLSFTPGDAASAVLGVNGTSRAAYAHVRHQLGLDRPLYVQYGRWLEHAIHGDLGTSLLSGQAVSETITQRLPTTLSLMFGALIVALVVGVILGVVSAVVGGVVGRFVDALALAGFALPSFWIAAILIDVFAVQLRWLPAVGYVPLTSSPAQWLRSIALPVAALALGALAAIAKNTREAMLDSLSSEHIRMAWASGVPARSIYFAYALRDSALRIVTILSLMTIALLGGTIVVEAVFALPGLGGALVNAVLQHDFAVVQGIAVFFTAIIVCVSVLTDLTYAWLDPRVRAR